MPTADVQHRITQRPHDDFTGVETNGFLPANPVYGLTGDIEPQDARYSILLYQRCNHALPFDVCSFGLLA